MVGLTNLGNTCYINVIIQLLANISVIKEYYLNTQWGNAINTNNNHKTAYKNKYQKIK